MLSLCSRLAESQSLWWIVGACYLCVLSVCYSSNTSYCGPPCTPDMCTNVTKPCPHGTFVRCGGCCYDCLAGPGEDCDAGMPACGHGLRCVGANTVGHPSFHIPGRCEPTNSTTTTPSVETTEPHPTSATEEPTSGDDMLVHCRAACSVSFCSEDGTNKKRICSAAGLSPVMPERNKCQHTSCRSCFLLKDPDCRGRNVTCPEPPNKACLRDFYHCIRDHYFGPHSSAMLLRLEDPAARTTPGRVVCHIPEVSDTSEKFSGQGGESSANGP